MNSYRTQGFILIAAGVPMGLLVGLGMVGHGWELLVPLMMKDQVNARAAAHALKWLSAGPAVGYATGWSMMQVGLLIERRTRSEKGCDR